MLHSDPEYMVVTGAAHFGMAKKYGADIISGDTKYVHCLYLVLLLIYMLLSRWTSILRKAALPNYAFVSLTSCRAPYAVGTFRN